MEGVSVYVDMSPPIFSHRMEGDVRIVVDACVWCGGTRSIDREMCGWTHRSSMRQMQWAGLQIEMVDRCVELRRVEDETIVEHTTCHRLQCRYCNTHKKNRATYANKHPSIGIAITWMIWDIIIPKKSPTVVPRRPFLQLQHKQTYLSKHQTKKIAPPHTLQAASAPLSVFETDWNLPCYSILLLLIPLLRIMLWVLRRRDMVWEIL